MVDLRRLRALRAVADHGTLAAAADALHLTPSAVSQQLAALERETGHALLEPVRAQRAPDARGARPARATPTRCSRSSRSSRATSRRRTPSPRGEVRIGGFPTALAGLLAPAARPLHAVAPAVTLRIQEAETPEAVGHARGPRRGPDPRHGVLGRAAARRHALPPRGAAGRRAGRRPADRSPAGRPRPHRPRRARRRRAGSRRPSAGRATRSSSPAAAARASRPRSRTARATGRR